MTPTNARLSFVVRFIQTDLSALSERGWKHLRQEIRDFLSVNNERIVERSRKPWTIVAHPANDGSLARLLTQEGISDLQKKARHVLRVALQDIENPQYTYTKKMRGPVSTKPMRTSLELFRARSWFVTVRGDATEIFLFAVMLLMARGADTQLRLCPACKNVFVRIGRKKYCSPRCKNRTNVSTFRKKQIAV